MEKRKKILTLLSVAIITTAIFAPLLVKTVAAADPTDWYSTVNGVLDTDTYTLYPFEESSLKFGLSKFGELIDSTTNVGLEYDGARDPFAAPAGSSIDESKLPKKVWINGWYIDIRYVHEDWGQRNVWAGALFADKSDYGKNWIRVDNNYTYPLSPQYEWQETFDDKGLELDEDLEPIPGLVNGGRKTNGTAVTEDLTVLYDGPRLFVAKSVTHIYDWYEEEDENLHLVDVVLTIMFNKVKKEVVVIKDVKFIEQAKFVIADLPITPPEGEETTIPMALLVQFSNREEWDLGAKNVAGTIDYSSYVHFYTAGTGTNDAVSEGQDTVYNEDWTMLPTLPAGVAYEGQEINAHGSEPASSGTYDVAQIISNDELYVGWHAFWPSLSDWSADAARSSTKTWYRAMVASDPHWIDSYSGSEPFLSPLIVGEWDFILAVHKATQRWVEYHYGSTSWTSEHKPVMDVSDEDWDQYCVFSERVEDLTTGEVLIRGVDYDFSVDSDGYATITGLTSTHYYKILYSTDTVYGYEGDMDFEFDAIETQASQGYILKDGEWELSYEWEDWLGAYHSIALGGTITIRNVTEITGNHTWTYEDSINPYAYDVKVFKEDVATVLGVEGLNLPPENMTDEGNVTEISIFNIWGWWDVEGPEGLDLHIDYLDIVVTWNVTIDYNAATNNYTVTLLITLTPYEENDYLYLEHIPGRYEWTIVGRDAASVDSAGAALVTAAFKNKQVEIGLAGADMYDPLPYNQMPWVMNKFGTDDERADYYYSGTDYRTALKDDWCTTWPISSSNMIGVGGPLANVLAYYGNDFAQAIFGLDDFTDYADWEEVIIPLTCWDITKTQAYASSNETGYAVISTYKDINGTVLFLVWGHWGRDTFYASKWFHEEGIYQLQDAPDGLTAIILEISYESSSEGYKPTGFSIVECLGTISETEWIHGLETKGGFHDP